MGAKDSKYVVPLARAKTDLEADKIWRQLSRKCQEYLAEIEREQWMDLAWVNNPSLPSRYDIVSSNMVESNNNMFDDSRGRAWCDVLDINLRKISDRIARRVSGKHGLIPSKAEELNKMWDASTKLECYATGLSLGLGGNDLEAGDDEHFNVAPMFAGAVGDIAASSFNVNVKQHTCDCGAWNKDGLPCVHAMAYFRGFKRMTLEAITADVVERHYKYDEERRLLQRTIMPVSVCRLCPDSDTLPPRELEKNSAGRPKNDNRIRNRSVHDAEDSPIVCSLCGGRGRNKHTCAPRQRLAILREQALPGQPYIQNLNLS